MLEKTMTQNSETFNSQSHSSQKSRKTPIDISTNYKTLSLKRFQKFNPVLLAQLQTLERENQNEIELIFRGHIPQNFNNRLTDNDLEILSQILLPLASEITNIDFSCNLITHKGIKDLCLLLRKAVNLKALNLQNNTINSEGGNFLFEALINLKQQNDHFSL